MRFQCPEHLAADRARRFSFCRCRSADAFPTSAPLLSPTNIFAPVSPPAKSIFGLLCLYSQWRSGIS
jgi:hypothetical protein